jgi:predicted secreted protein
MPSIAKTGQGTLFKIGDGGGTEVFTTVPEVMRVNAPNVKTELNDVTSHDSTGGFREFLPGQKDGDTVSAEHNWVPSNAIHKQLRIDAYAATKRNFKTTFPDTTDHVVSFTGYITEVNPTANTGEPMRATTTVKVTGQPTWGNT